MENTRQKISRSTWRTTRHLGVQSAKLKIITRSTAIWTWRTNRIIMQSIRPMQLHKIMSKTTHQTIRTTNYMKVEDTSTGMTIDMEAMEVEVNSLEIKTTDHIDPSNALHAIRRDIDMQTIHINTELTSNFYSLWSRGSLIRGLPYHAGKNK